MSAGHSTGALVLVGTAALALGAAATVVIYQPENQAKLRDAKKKIAELLKSWGLGQVYTYIVPTESINGTQNASLCLSISRLFEYCRARSNNLINDFSMI